MTHLTANAKQLLSYAVNASTEDYNAGLCWYQQAHDLAVTLATQYGYELWQTAGVIAALSPQQSWAFNQRAAAAAIEAHSKGEPVTQQMTGQTQANVSKALRILDGEALTTTIGACLPKSGHKVWSFAQNIIAPSVSRNVTIDRWAVKAWATPETEFKHLTPNRYARCEADYQAAAAALGIMPSQLQAIVWVAIRGSAD